MTSRSGKRMCVATALLVSMPAGAQELFDPTRPPDVSGSQQQGGAQPPGAPASPSLQSILVAPGRRHAVIDGREVHVGDRLGDARVVAIEPDYVRLREGRTFRVMKLIPDVQRSGTKLSTPPPKEAREGPR